jgi:hypothetical protein
VAGGPPGYAVTGASRGIIPRAVEALLAGCEAARSEGWSASLTAVYLQQYGERLFDLRHPLPSASQPWGRDKDAARALAGLELRPEPGGGVAAAGAEPCVLSTLDDVAELLRAGAQHRALRATELNDASSRSHAILQIVVEMTRDAGAKGGARYRRAKLNLVDLAGSEKWAPGETSLAPERVAELCAINASLAALGACVRALGTGSAHVPARDSKLTRLLADALGGGALTALVATLSPSALSYDESASTLRFADAAGRVQVTARPAGGGGLGDEENDGDAAAAAVAARAEVARLTALLRSLTGDDDGAKAALEADNARLRKELAEAKKAEKAAARRAADAARVAAAAGAEKAAAERAAAEAAANKRSAAPRRAPSTLQASHSASSQPLSAQPSSAMDDDDDAVLAALRPAPPPRASPVSRLPQRDASNVSTASVDTRLSAGWSSDLDDEGSPTQTPPPPPPPNGSGPNRSSGGSGSGASSSAAWLAEYAEAKRAAAAAAAAARAARADGGWRGSAASGGARPGTATAAWEEQPFFSKRAPTPPAPPAATSSLGRSTRPSNDGAGAAVPASTVRARGIYGSGSAAAGPQGLSASQRLAAAKARNGSAVTPPARAAVPIVTPLVRNAATAPAAGRAAPVARAVAAPKAAAAPVAQAASPQRTRVRAASGVAAAALPAAAPRATAPPPRPTPARAPPSPPPPQPEASAEPVAVAASPRASEQAPEPDAPQQPESVAEPSSPEAAPMDADAAPEASAEASERHEAAEVEAEAPGGEEAVAQEVASAEAAPPVEQDDAVAADE